MIAPVIVAALVICNDTVFVINAASDSLPLIVHGVDQAAVHERG